MELKASYKPWLLCGSENDGRPTLAHALVERLTETRGRIIAADGFMMGVFPVELDPGEPEGLVKASLLYYASRFERYRSAGGRDVPDHVYGMQLEDGWVEMPDGSRHPRQLEDVPAYPSRQAILQGVQPSDNALGRIALDPVFLRRAQRALGYSAVVILDFTAPRLPIVVRPGNMGLTNWDSPWDDPSEPFALLMPCAPRPYGYSRVVPPRAG